MRKGFWCLGAGFCAVSAALCYVWRPSWPLFAALAAVSIAGLAAWKKSETVFFGALALLGGALSVFCFLWAARPEKKILQTAQTPGRYTALALDYSEAGRYGEVAKVRLLTEEKPVVMAYLPKGAQLAPGDLVSGEFAFSVPENTGSFPAQRYYRAKGILLTAKVREAVVSKAGQTPPSFWPAYVRKQAVLQTERLFGNEAAVMKALLFGDRREFDPSFQADVSVTGMAHIFAVSGMHLSFLVSAVMLLGRRRKWVASPAAALMLAMMAVTGFPPSVVRAGIMQGLALLAYVLGREEDGFSALLLALCVLILLNPWSIADAGLQFSFLSVLGLMTVGKRISDGLASRIKPRGRFARRAWYAFASAAAATVSAQAATLPLSVLYFGQVSLVAVLANLLLLWCVSAVFLGAILALVLSAAWFPAGQLAAQVVSFGGAYIRLVIILLARLPMAVFGAGGRLFAAWVFLAYGLCTAALAVKLKNAWRLGLLLLVLCALAVGLDAYIQRESFSVWALDVGSGQCIVLSAGGKTAVIDCGSQSADAAEELLAHFRRHNLTTIDALVLTHFDLDHVSGAEALLQRGMVKCLYVPRFTKNTDIAERLLGEAYANGVPVLRISADERAAVGKIFLHFFAVPGGSGGNASGLAVLAQTREANVLVLGDIDDERDEYLAQTRALPGKISVLVAGHHGAKAATSQTLLEKTLPEYVIISVGRNSYGHPAPETLARIASIGANIRRTDQNGTVFFRFYKGKVYER